MFSLFWWCRDQDLNVCYPTPLLYDKWRSLGDADNYKLVAVVRQGRKNAFCMTLLQKDTATA